jgi:hypothetical protein
VEPGTRARHQAKNKTWQMFKMYAFAATFVVGAFGAFIVPQQNLVHLVLYF